MTVVGAAGIRMGASSVELRPGSSTVAINVQLTRPSVLPSSVGLHLSGPAEVRQRVLTTNIPVLAHP